MLADNAARILARRAGLGAKAGRVRRQRDRQLVLVQNFVAIEVGDGHFGSGNEPVIVVLEFAPRHRIRVRIGAAKQVLGKLGQLAGAEETLAVHHERRQHLGVAVLLRVQVEHEADQRPLQPRPGAHVHRKARPAQLGRAFKVQDAKRFAQFPVRLGLKIERAASHPRS